MLLWDVYVWSWLEAHVNYEYTGMHTVLIVLSSHDFHAVKYKKLGCIRNRDI